MAQAMHPEVLADSSQEQHSQAAPQTSLSLCGDVLFEIQQLEQKPLPTFDDIGVEASKTIRRPDLDSPHGIYWQRDVVMSDGVERTEVIGISKCPKTSVVTVSVPPWWTSVTGGFNIGFSNRLHEAGVNTFMQGISKNKPASLARSAHDLHASMDYHNEAFAYNFNFNTIVYNGDSNGGMTGAGALAMAERFGRNIAYAYLLDPCIAKRISFEDAKNFIARPDYAAKEVWSLFRQVGRMALDPQESALLHLKTIEPSKGYAIGNFLLAAALFSGDFGHLAAHIPEDQRGEVKLFCDSLANQKKHTLQIVRGSSGHARPYLKTSVRTGTHASILNPHVQRAKAKRVADEALQAAA